MFDPIQIGRRLRLARMRKGYKQKDIADLLGIAKSMASEIESGKRGHKLETFVNWCFICEASADEILGLK